jgi:hypothetical protein
VLEAEITKFAACGARPGNAAPYKEDEMDFIRRAVWRHPGGRKITFGYFIRPIASAEEPGSRPAA